MRVSYKKDQRVRKNEPNEVVRIKNSFSRVYPSGVLLKSSVHIK